MKKFDFLPHTADFKFKIYGKNLEEIINNSLLALKEFFEPQLTEKKVEKEIEVESIDKISLLVDFLSEVLAKTYIEKVIFTQFEKKILSSKNIKGKISGFVFEKVTKDIKAITYHQARLNKVNSGFVFEFIIDV